MADLKTNYKDYVASGDRKYSITANADGSSSITDVTTYTQTGDTFGASDINATNTAINELNQNLVHTLHGTTCMDTSPYLGHVVFSTPMKNTDYSIMLTPRCTVDQSANTAVYGACVYNKTVNGFDYTAGGAAGSSSWYVDWTVIY